MLIVKLNSRESGWAFAILSDGINELILTGPYSPVDVLRDLINAVASLKTVENADCCWLQEPGELHWRFRRTDKELQVEILRFSDGVSPGYHRGQPASVFKASGEWDTFARQLLSSLESIRVNLGLDGYQRAWRHPFPKEAFERLRNAIQRT